ncbi:GNAT family N-acetyltransferase [uncultured Kiloniella sp.]|uniref:GNAT family N-acetyltransferase n=1 Tax=uncultured Kiloniella sp. TaxID=1133091 RepID=UPI0026287380|nr:GNAT family N-acetyltransferase [uncultured Kiloniella sp.]
MTESITKDHFEIRLAEDEEIQFLCDLAAGEGWNPGLRDIECFYQADKTGFYLGVFNGEPIGCISAVKYGDDYGFVGFYIVKEPWRGKGFGIAIWNHALASLKGRIIGLDGVVDQQDNYMKSGFKLSHRNLRFEGTAKAQGSKAENLVDVKTVPFEQVAAFDAGCFFEERKTFLETWLGEEGHIGFAVVEDQQVRGYGLIRPYCDGYKTGPLFAADPVVANDIFNALCAEVEGHNIILDVPENNADGVLLAESYGLVQSFETARMYKGGAVDLPLDKIYGVTSFELG